MALGRAWAGAGSSGKNELESDLQVLGIQLDIPAPEAAPVPVWAEHGAAFEVFLACSRQWRIIAGPTGMFYQGIDATALAATMDMMGTADRQRCLQQVRHIESGALELINQH